MIINKKVYKIIYKYNKIYFLYALDTDKFLYMLIEVYKKVILLYL